MAKKKKRYRLTCPIEDANGIQVYEVEAATPEGALAVWKKGETECVCEEIEVTRLGEPEIEEIDD